MKYHGGGSLAATGATITVGGIAIDQLWLLAAAASLMLLGALLVRFSWRRGKGVNQR